MSDNTDMTLLEALWWWGVPSLLRCPVNPDPAACDIALVGVPHASGNGSTERDQHLGPRAVRNVSAHNRRLHKAFGYFNPWEACRIHDLGDVPLPEAMANEACIEQISRYFRRIADAGTRVVSIGGDHSISGAILQAIAGEGSALTDGKPVALVHIDAHTDTYENIEHWMGARKSAAHWAAYTVRQGNVDASRSTQLGIRGNTRSADWLETSTNLGYDLIEMETYRARGPMATIAPHPGADRRQPRLHLVRPRLARSQRRPGGLEPGGGRRRLQHRRGERDPARLARPRHRRRRRGLPDADEGPAEPDHGDGGGAPYVRADQPHRRPHRWHEVE